MTTPPVSAEHDSLTGSTNLNDPAVRAARVDNPDFEAAVARFVATRERLHLQDAILPEVVRALHEYDVYDGPSIDEPVEAERDSAPTEYDYFNPEAHLVAQMFLARPEPFVLDPIATSADVVEPVPVPEVEFIVPAVEDVEEAQDLQDMDADARGFEAQVTVIPAPLPEPTPEQVQRLRTAPRPAPFQAPEVPVAVVEWDSSDADANLVEVPLHDAAPTSRVPSLTETERDAIRETPFTGSYVPEDRPSRFDPTPEPPEFMATPVVVPDLGEDVPSAFVPEPVNPADVLTPPSLTPVPLDLGSPDDEPAPRRRAGVAELLEEPDTDVVVAEPVNLETFADRLYTEEAEPLEEASVAVDAKKSRFSRPSKPPKPAKDKSKPDAAPKKVKARKDKKAETEGEPKPERSKKSSRKRLMLAVAAVVLSLVFVLAGGLVGAKAFGYEPSNIATNAASPTLPVTGLVMAKDAPVSSFAKGDPVVITRADGTKVFGFFFSGSSKSDVQVYDNVNLKPRAVGVDSIANPVLTVANIGTEVTTALNSPVPAAAAALSLAGAVGAVVLRRKA